MTHAQHERDPLAKVASSKDLSTRNFLVVGLARNLGRNIKTDVRRLSAALKAFPNLKWLIVESDSDDDTIEKLQELEAEMGDFRFISLGALRENLPYRTQRIACCRNKYLDELKNNVAYKDIDYVIVADLDGLNDAITEQAFLSCWVRDDWDVCTANQRGPYYDVWALRHTDWSPNDCWAQRDFFRRVGLSAEESLSAAVYSKMITIGEEADWIEVDSSFGGLAIYRKEALKDAQYVGGWQVCEHIHLHAQLRADGKRIFINPRFINAAYTEHTRHLLLSQRVKRTFTNALKGLLVRTVGADSLSKLKTIVAKKDAQRD